MLISGNKLSKSAEALYKEHIEIASSIEQNQNYIASAEEMKRVMARSALEGVEAVEPRDVGISTYNENMNVDIGFVKRDIEELEVAAAQNQAAAAHLAQNPKLYDLAVKEARKDGVDLSL